MNKNFDEILDVFQTRDSEEITELIRDGVSEYSHLLDDEELEYVENFLSNIQYYAEKFTKSRQCKQLVGVFREGNEDFLSKEAAVVPAIGAWFINAFFFDWCNNLGLADDLNQYLEKTKNKQALGFYQLIGEVPDYIINYY
jgi:hypothetical protein